jgi:hypothetical protein
VPDSSPIKIVYEIKAETEKQVLNTKTIDRFNSSLWNCVIKHLDWLDKSKVAVVSTSPVTLNVKFPINASELVIDKTN